MISGQDMLFFLKIDIKFSEEMLSWDESEMHCHTEEAISVLDAAKQIEDILDAKCQAADLEKVCSLQSHLDLAATTPEVTQLAQEVQRLV